MSVIAPQNGVVTMAQHPGEARPLCNVVGSLVTVLVGTENSFLLCCVRLFLPCQICFLVLQGKLPVMYEETLYNGHLQYTFVKSFELLQGLSTKGCKVVYKHQLVLHCK